MNDEERFRRYQEEMRRAREESHKKHGFSSMSELNLPNKEDWDKYRKLEESMTKCGPGEVFVRGYWTHKGYHKSYCRKVK